MKDEEYYDKKNFWISACGLIVIFALGITYLINDDEFVGVTYAIFSLVWFAFEGNLIKDAATTVLKKRLLVLIYTDASTVCAFATLLYKVVNYESIFGKILSSIITIILMLAARYGLGYIFKK